MRYLWHNGCRCRLHEQGIDENCNGGNRSNHESDCVPARPSQDGKQERRWRLAGIGRSYPLTDITTAAAEPGVAISDYARQTRASVHVRTSPVASDSLS